MYKFMGVALLDTARSFIYQFLHIIYYPIHPLPANKLILPWNLVPTPSFPYHGKEGVGG
jgi:hypothetical protein